MLESFVTKERDKASALKIIKKAMRRHGRPEAINTDGVRSYGAPSRERASPGVVRLTPGSKGGANAIRDSPPALPYCGQGFRHVS